MNKEAALVWFCLFVNWIFQNIIMGFIVCCFLWENKITEFLCVNYCVADVVTLCVCVCMANQQRTLIHIHSNFIYKRIFILFIFSFSFFLLLWRKLIFFSCYFSGIVFLSFLCFCSLFVVGVVVLGLNYYDFNMFVA